MRMTLPRTVAPRAVPHRRFRPDGPGAEPAGRGLFAGEPVTCRRDLRHFVPILAHLALLVFVFETYSVEGRAFQLLVKLAAFALPVHYLLPYRWKEPAFVAASLGALAWVFGPLAAVAVAGLGAVLIGACYLPVRWGLRATLVACLAAALAVARGGMLGDLVPDAAWPVLGSLFLFRMLLYLYELRHADRPEPLGGTLAYFFLLPNACFLHFPVVDYRTFRRGFLADDIHATQRAGLAMLVTGMTHLLAYRLVYHFLWLPAEEVQDFATLSQHLVGNYLLYLRVSGQFHAAAGLLGLFGYALPATHRHYLLAGSFTDYWRRINIYWKDFMVRVVFNPVAFALKRRPQWAALAAATAAVFATTWALHLFQSFWVRGVWTASLPDALFWATLGALVLVNVQLEAATPRSRPTRPLPLRLASRSLRTLGTFAAIALLWSLWSSPSVGSWATMLSRGVGLSAASAAPAPEPLFPLEDG